MNKLYLPFFRFSWYVDNTTDVVRALNGLDYVFFRFRRPVDYISADLDILINYRDVDAALASALLLVSPTP